MLTLYQKVFIYPTPRPVPPMLKILTPGFSDQSALLKHELAYVLGQMKNTKALPTLESVLRDSNEDPMVRHEAAEAMGAISSVESLPVLREFIHDPHREVRETCEIAVAKVEWDNSDEGKAEKVQKAEENAYVNLLSYHNISYYPIDYLLQKTQRLQHLDSFVDPQKNLAKVMSFH